MLTGTRPGVTSLISFHASTMTRPRFSLAWLFASSITLLLASKDLIPYAVTFLISLICHTITISFSSYAGSIHSIIMAKAQAHHHFHFIYDFGIQPIPPLSIVMAVFMFQLISCGLRRIDLSPRHCQFSPVLASSPSPDKIYSLMKRFPDAVTKIFLTRRSACASLHWRRTSYEHMHMPYTIY